MRLDPGTMIAVAAALLFYLRLIILQRQRSKKKAGSASQPPALFVIRSPILIGAGVFLLGVGAVISTLPLFASFGPAWWWVPVTLGILLMGLGVG